MTNYIAEDGVELSEFKYKETIDEAFKNGANGYFAKSASYKDFVVKAKILMKCS